MIALNFPNLNYKLLTVVFHLYAVNVCNNKMICALFVNAV